MTPEEEQAMMMEVIGGHEGPGPVTANFADPTQALVPMLSREFNIPAEEILAIPPVEGMTLRQQLEGLRPNTNIGGLELGVDGSVKEPRITGRMEF